MSFPAFEAFAADHRIRRNTFCVYMKLQREYLNHHTPVEVKTLGLAQDLKLRRASVINALNWLVTHGYLIEKPRGTRGERALVLAWSLPTSSQSGHICSTP